MRQIASSVRLLASSHDLSLAHFLVTFNTAFLFESYYNLSNHSPKYVLTYNKNI